MANIKISQLPAKGANLASTDLVEISEFNGSGYVSKSITGQEIIDAASGGSGVTDVTATSPIASTGGATPDISITQAGAATDGYLSTGDWNAFNNKQNALVSGTNIKTLNGASLLGSGGLSVQPTLVSGTNIKTVNSTSLLGSGDVSVGVTNVTGTSPIVSTGGATPAISIATANTSTTGALTSTDWNTFNGKQAALVSGTNIKTINGSSVLGSGDLVINAGNRLATHILAKPRSGFNYSISLTQGNLTTGSQTANTLVLTAFTPAYNFEIDRFILNVSTLAAGGLAKVVVYSDLDGVPNSKLYESATVTTDTTGLKTMSGFTYLFSAGVTYWIGVVTNTSVAQFTVLNSASLMLAPVIASTTSTQIFTCWSIPVTFASLPATLTTPTTGNLSHLSVPYIMFRAF